MSGAATLVGRAAGLAAILLVQAYWFLQPAPVALRVLAAVVLGTSILSPRAGLLLFAGLAPLSTSIAALGGGAGLGSQLLEQMMLGVAAGAVLRAAPEGRTRIGGPALLLAVVAGTSAISLLPAAVLAGVPPGIGTDERDVLRLLADRRLALASPAWAPVLAALTVAACAALAWSTERLVRHAPYLVTRLLVVALAGHAAAALLNLSSLVTAALTTGDLASSLPRLLMGARLSLQTDVHAAASAMLLAGLAGFGLTHGSRVRSIGVGALMALVAMGLWITGSRVAIVIGLAAATAALGWAASARVRRIVVLAIVLIVLGVGGWLAQTGSGRYTATSVSVGARVTLLDAGFTMFKSAPLFGIGIGQFYGKSAEVVGPEIDTLVGYTHENAHNNFMQVLAEQGVVGLAALLWALGVVLVSSWRAERTKADPRRWALMLALVACIGTWFTGHPLLVTEFAAIFWMYCGLLLAMTPAVPVAQPRWLTWICIAAVAASVVPRAIINRRDAGLEHLGRGVSRWLHDDEQRYREAGSAFTLFLPSGSRPVAVPLRRAPGAPDPLLIDIQIDGRVMDTLPLSGDHWQVALVVVPGSNAFERVEFLTRPAASGPSSPGVLLRVGRDVVR